MFKIPVKICERYPPFLFLASSRYVLYDGKGERWMGRGGQRRWNRKHELQLKESFQKTPPFSII